MYMDKKRFLVDKIDGEYVHIIGDEHLHLSQVLRSKVGDHIIVVCGDEYDYECEIISIDKKSTLAKVVNKTKNTANPHINLTAFVCLIKNDHMNLVVQKLSELGATDIIPFYSTYTVVKDKGNKVDKLQKIADQSIKQCERSIPLKVHDTISFDDMLGMLNKFDAVYFANENENKDSIDDEFDPNAKNIAMIVGCEGGFSPSEVKTLEDSGAKSVTLGGRILRAETASIALCSVLMYKYGEWK